MLLLLISAASALPLLLAQAPPVDWADCTACHQIEDQGLPTLAQLRPAGLGPALPASCYTCHTELELARPVLEWTHPVRSVAAHVGCTQCHAAVAHGAGHPPPIPVGDYKAQGCYACHAGVRAERRMAHSHGEMKGLRCIDCHPAHEPLRAALPALLVPQPARRAWHAYDWQASNSGCLHCHPAGTLFFSLTQGFVMLNTENYHERHVERGVLCIECHEPHGSLQHAMLRTRLLTGETLSCLPESSGGHCSITCHGVQHEGWEYRSGAP